MKKILLTLTFSILASLAFSQTSFTVGGIHYINTSSNIVAVTSGGTYVGNITIPSIVSYSGLIYNVTSIESSAFFIQRDVTSITIPSSITYIGISAFSGCTALINVESNNNNYSSKDGALYNKNFTILIQCPVSLKQGFTIPSTITSIGSGAFYDCTGLTSITIPASVTSIGSSAFSYCIGLTSITIPSSVTSIGSNVFFSCTALINVESNNNSYSSKDGVLFNKDYTTIIKCPESLKQGFIIPSSVTSIGNGAFGSCTGLVSITIPSSVTSIGGEAFEGCTGLTTITIPSSVTSIGSYAFRFCAGLTSITIPSSVTSIGSYAFNGLDALINVESNNNFYSSKDGVLFNKDCTTLIQCPESLKQGFTIPSSVTSIGSGAFGSCTGLTSITIPPSVTSIGDNAFGFCTGLTSITIPPSITSIGSYAFSYCWGLTIIIIPSSVTSIGSDAFRGCTALINIESNNNNYSSKDGVLYNKDFTILIQCPESLKQGFTIPSSLTSIGDNAFRSCTGLTSITIPPSVTSIGSNAFSSCTGLTSITIPASVTSIGSDAFSICTALINVESNNNSYSSKDGVLFNKDYTTLIHCPESLKQGFTIPSSVTSIESYAFYNCNELTAITISPSLTTIGGGAFSGCHGLTSITIPPSVTSIGGGAFSYCTGLTSITIPSSVTYIGISAFLGCTALINVESNNNNYSSKDGALYNKNFTILIQCPSSLIQGFTIPPSVTSIGEVAFFGCWGLTSITIPASVTTIGDYVFSNCSGLKIIYSYISNPTDLNEGQFQSVDLTNCKLYIPIGTSSLYKAATGWKDFQNIIEAFIPMGSGFNVDGLDYIVKDMNSVGITGKTTYSGIIIPSIVNYLGIDYNITSLGNGSLEYYSNFTDISVPDKVASIGNYTFNSCSELNKIQLPSGLQSIGDYAFYNCTSLSEIRVNSVAPPTLGSNTFYLVDKTKCTLYVPTGSLDTYKSADQWKDFLNIVEFDATGVENPGSQLIKFYPNPTSSFIHIDLVDDIDSQILKIYNASGQKFYEMRESDNHIQIDVSSYPSGLYFIQTTDQNNRVTNIGRFIRE